MVETVMDAWRWAAAAPPWQPVMVALAIVGAAYFVRTMAATALGRLRWRKREKVVKSGLADSADLRASTLTRYRGPED